MADAANDASLLVDLGAGTGAITAALCERHPDVPLVAIELQTGLAAHLRERFPLADVRCASADKALAELTTDAPPDTVVVSSLPFRSLPNDWRRRTIAAVESFLLADPRRRLVQYTYQPRAPFEPAANCLRWRHVTTVWRNAPPAGVWTLQCAP